MLRHDFPVPRTGCSIDRGTCHPRSLQVEPCGRIGSVRGLQTEAQYLSKTCHPWVCHSLERIRSSCRPRAEHVRREVLEKAWLFIARKQMSDPSIFETFMSRYEWQSVRSRIMGFSVPGARPVSRRDYGCGIAIRHLRPKASRRSKLIKLGLKFGYLGKPWDEPWRIQHVQFDSPRVRLLHVARNSTI